MRIYLCRTSDERASGCSVWGLMNIGRHAEPATASALSMTRSNSRRGRDGQMRDMVFEDPEIAGAYVGRYLAGGQLEQSPERATHRSWKPLWVSPTSLEAERVVTAAVSVGAAGLARPTRHLAGAPKGPFGGLTTRRPSPWSRLEFKAWVLSVVGLVDGRTVTDPCSWGAAPRVLPQAAPPAGLLVRHRMTTLLVQRD